MTRLVSMGTLSSAALHGGVAALLLTQGPFSQTHDQNTRAVPIGLTFVAARQEQTAAPQSASQVPFLEKKTQPPKEKSHLKKKTRPAPCVTSSHGPQPTPCAQSEGVPDVPPKILFAPKPHYPEEAKRQGQAGVAHVGVRVDVRGYVEEVRLVKTSGSRLLDASALEAVSKWRFMAGGPKSTHAVVPVRFTLTPRA